jgi:hypothetical protein
MREPDEHESLAEKLLIKSGTCVWASDPSHLDLEDTQLDKNTTTKRR